MKTYTGKLENLTEDQQIVATGFTGINHMKGSFGLFMQQTCKVLGIEYNDFALLQAAEQGIVRNYYKNSFYKLLEDKGINREEFLSLYSGEDNQWLK